MNDLSASSSILIAYFDWRNLSLGEVFIVGKLIATV